MDFLDQVSGDGRNVRAYVATVTALTSPTITVSLHGQTLTGVRVAKVYTPVVDDYALILHFGDSWLAMTDL